MKYSKEERLDIGRQIYHDEISRYEAAERFGIDDSTARDYMRLYRDANDLPSKNYSRRRERKPQSTTRPDTLEEIKAMSRDELVDALITARINEARLKKGYQVKGVGADKEYVLLGKENTK